MRSAAFIIACAAVMMAAASCGPQQGQTQGCAREAAHEALWSHASTPDSIVARSEGESCADAAVTLNIMSGAGAALWEFRSSYYEMAVGGPAPENAASVPAEDVRRFLASWADVTIMRASGLPAWDEVAPAPGAFGYQTPLARPAYEALRASDGPILCYAAAIAATQCLAIGAEGPAMILAFGA